MKTAVFTLALLSSTASLVMPGSAQAFSDANWVSLGGVSGATSPYPESFQVYAAAVDSAGNLYIGGAFQVAGTVTVNNIAKWNGTNWCALGAGVDGTVNALAVSGTNLYAGGTFTTAGGVLASNIARWDGTSWSALGNGVSGVSVSSFVDAHGWWRSASRVNALAVLGTNLYVGGYFTNAGGVLASNIAQWNGSSWSALLGLKGHVFALTVAGGKLYAGGRFVTPDVFTPNSVAQWDGRTWSSLGPGVDDRVNGLAVLGTTLYAAGSFLTAGGVPAENLAQWDGSAWSALSSGSSGTTFPEIPYALAAVDGKLYVGGEWPPIAQWDGNTWSTLGSGIAGGDGWVFALAASESNLFVGGDFTQAGTKQSINIAEAILVPSSAPPSILSTGASFGFTSGNSSFGFDVAGSQAQTVAVLASTNLVNWVPLQTYVLDGTVVHFSDPAAGNFKRRFYRAELVP